MEHVDRKSPEMRTDGDFIHQLREEIANTQERRVRFIKAKLAFAVALLGVGGISIGPLNNTTVLLYLIPFVTFVFDFYILSEDFSTKRIATFIKLSPAAPNEEKLWEKCVDEKRNPYSYWAGPISSLTILFASASGIYFSKPKIYCFCIWLIVSCCLIFPLFIYRILRKNSMRKFEEAIKKEISSEERYNLNFSSSVHKAGETFLV